ncbi:MAG: hypothetical protein H8E31_09020 [Planctomycetes bacterium]|nr:hypothetical protein [Planctomycetota bacterium]
MFLSALFLPVFLSLPQDLPAGSPHPTHVVNSRSLQEAAADGFWSTERPVWQALAPRWAFDEAVRLLDRDDAEVLLAFVASRNHWSERDLARWAKYAEAPPVALRFSLKDAHTGELLLAGSHQVQPGVPTAIRDLVLRSVVMGLDVEIACDSAIADPVAGSQFAGASIAVELLPVPGLGYQAEVAVVDSGFGAEDAIQTGYSAIQGFDRLRQDLAETGWRSLLVPGHATSFRLPGVGRRALVLELECGGPVPPESLSAGDTVAVCMAPSLAEDPETWNRLQTSLELIGDTWAASSGYLAFSGGAVEDQIAEVRDALAQGCRPIRLAMRVTVENADGAVELLDLGGHFLLGAPFRFASGELALALTDWDVEVAQASRIADPRFETLFDGVRGSIEAQPNGGVRLDLELTRVSHGQPMTLTLSRESPSGDHGDGRTGGQPADVVAVERPEVARLGVDGDFRLDAGGKLVIERQAPGFLGSRGRLRVEIEVVELN